MNFYIGNSINELDINDLSVEFSDELLDFICKKSQQLLYDIGRLYDIDPYSDMEISSNDLSEIIKKCRYILDESLIENYKEREEGNQMLHELIKIAEKAMIEKKGLISIGD